MNYSLLKTPSTLLGDQATHLLNRVRAALARGATQTLADLIGAISSAFTSFYNTLGQPIHTALQFSGPPIAEDWNDYTLDVTTDLNVLYRQHGQLAAAAQRALLYSNVETGMLTDATAALANQINSFAATRPTKAGMQSYVLSDGFQDSSKVDLNASTADILEGTVALAAIDETDVTDKVSLWVDDDYMEGIIGLPAGAASLATGASNGFPGNLHEVIVPENTNTLTGNTDQIVQLNTDPGNAIAFAGDADLHAQVGALVDGNASTWFEYELCNIPDTVKYNPCQAYGFTIKVPQQGKIQPISWAAFHEEGEAIPQFFPALPSTSKVTPYTSELDANGRYVGVGGSYDPQQTTMAIGGDATLADGSAAASGGVLRLVLAGVFATPQYLTQIAILPNVLNNKPPQVVSVQVRAADAAIWVDARPLVQPQNDLIVAAAAVSTDQTELWVLPHTLAAEVRIVIEQRQSYTAKIGHVVWVTPSADGDPTLLNTALGLQTYVDANATYQRVDGPALSLEKVLQPGAQGVLNCYEDTNNSVTGPLVEAFDGWRYAIALRGITFKAVSYQQTSTLVTRDFSVPVDIKRITLDVDEVIPEVGFDQDWIRYEVSFDGGGTWTAIAPRTHYTSSLPRTLAVNPAGSAPNAVTTANYSASNPAGRIRLRATLQRPQNDPTLVPRLRSYSLNLEGNPL